MSQVQEGEIRIEVIDEGIGLNLEDFKTNGIFGFGFGLFSIRERLEQIEG